MQVIVPTPTTPGGATRASSAGYWNSSGVWTVVGNDVVRIGYNPLSLTSPPAAIFENAATNLLLNSATLSTQTITVTSVTNVLSFYGTGTVVLSGAFSATLAGTGTSVTRSALQFTPAAGSLTLTVTGSVTMAQVEVGTSATTWITTTSAAATRAADIVTNGLVYSNIPEPDSGYPAWNSATTYNVGDQVSYLHRNYSSLRASNLNFNPLTDTTTPAYWLDVGPDNRYAMFDNVIGTSTSCASSNITVVIKNGVVNGISFMQMNVANIQVSLTDGSNNIVYSKSIDLSSGVILDWWQYFTLPIKRTTDFILTDVPTYLSGVLTVVMTAPSGTISCGNMVAGTIFDFDQNGFNANSVQASPTIGIIDYSVKTVDAFGNTFVVERNYKKIMSVKMVIDNSIVDSVASTLASVRATPCVWIMAGNLYQSGIVYGFYKDWSVEIAYATKSYCTMDIEGLI